MMGRWMAISLLAAAMVACTTKAGPESLQWTAQELGISSYYPEALLRLQRHSKSRFTATLEINKSNVKSSQMDGITGLALMARILVCPIWPFAEQARSSAVLTTTLSETKEAVHFELLLLDADEADRIAKSKAWRPDFWDFRDAAWESLRRDVCDNRDAFEPRSRPSQKG